MSKFLGLVGALEPEDGVPELIVLKDIEPETGEYEPKIIFGIEKIPGATSRESLQMIEEMAESYQFYFNKGKKRREDIQALKNRSVMSCNYIDVGNGEQYVASIKIELKSNLNPMIGQEFIQEWVEDLVKVLHENGGKDVKIEIV